MSTSPRTLWENSDIMLAGSSAQVRGAAMPWGTETRGAVALTFRVPGNSLNAFAASDDGAAVPVTMLVNPDEARGLAVWLGEAADAADGAGPPVFHLEPPSGEAELPAEPTPEPTPVNNRPRRKGKGGGTRR